MEVFNIFKPDMISDKEALKYYFNYMEKDLKIKEQQLYKISNWTMLSKEMYEKDLKEQQLDLEEELIKRKQLLTTILGYHLFYRNEMAAVNLYKLEKNDINLTLYKLSAFKKELRKRFVYDTDKFYLKITNWSDIDIKAPLNQIDLDLIKSSYLTLPSTRNFDNPDYSMIFFNKLHFPNPNVESIERELEILRTHGIISENNILKKEVIIEK